MDRLRSKPFVIGVVMAALVLALAGWKLAAPSAARGASLERYLPAETVGFVEVNNLRAQALKVIDSEAWRAFTRENQAASTLFMMGANHAGALDASYAVALIGAGAGADGRLAPQFVMVAEFNDRGAERTFENRVLRLVRERREQGVTTKTEQYGDAQLNVVTHEGGRGFVYARAGTAVFASNTVEAVKRVLDVRAGKSASLETSEAFRRARAQSQPDDGLFGFLDGAALARLVDTAQGRDERQVAAFRELFHGSGAASVQSVAFTSNFADGRVVERFVALAPGGGTGLVRTLAANPPTPQALVALVPEDAAQVFDASIANAPQTFDEFGALVNQVAEQTGRKSFADILSEVTNRTSIDLRNDIIGSLGAEVCLVKLSPGEERGGAIIINLKDAERFAQALERLAQHKNRAVTSRDYKGVTVRQMAGEHGHALNYAFVGGNFVGSGDAACVERIIDTAQGGRSLAGAAAYRAASATAPAGTQFVYYNSNADYLNRLGRMLGGRESEFKTEGQAAGLRPSFAYGISRADGFYVESQTPLGIFPRLLTAVTSKLEGKSQETADKQDAEHQPDQPARAE